MRDIRFRAWDKINKCMGEVETINFDIDLLWCVGNTEQINFENCVLMQFTGLLDKNGREIFEGDILGIEGLSQYSVIWHKENCAWKVTNNRDLSSEYLGDMEHCGNKLLLLSVLGNIYEHPDLLKEKSDG
jgi:uncharacterized phage protein (TIGR01671 family)